ncbi:MAG: hypothetical protein COU07_00815 [Candidatus Harrisonbacteria bacterium CG10_big_fil_rev_8_21_14_0_10_40_38]|uniref:Uncharacterized protein n=1 Tax=Candidatus Harrisonbacteria bacterium CG10_big_fil_rev_8_21_14_0_10_40_38 TaxID=1974583 RepID=A0A2H0USR2_9BACT|nr:MAG: hypothetical protein COU07_00815 [Candidatus Harrisonbacteria bacterium CG10_big_fil_rev_8_21_14_0_10_40_38]
MKTEYLIEAIVAALAVIGVWYFGASDYSSKRFSETVSFLFLVFCIFVLSASLFLFSTNFLR